MNPFITLSTHQGLEIGAISFQPAISSPWISLLAGVHQSVPIPDGAVYVRFAYDQTGADVYVAPEGATNIIIPSGGATQLSRAETNPVIRVVHDVLESGITTLNMVSDINTTVHLYFYRG